MRVLPKAYALNLIRRVVSVGILRARPALTLQYLLWIVPTANNSHTHQHQMGRRWETGVTRWSGNEIYFFQITECSGRRDCEFMRFVVRSFHLNFPLCSCGHRLVGAPESPHKPSRQTSQFGARTECVVMTDQIFNTTQSHK